MARARIHDIPAGHEDRNDHDTPRADPVFKLVADRSPDDDDLARRAAARRPRCSSALPPREGPSS